MDYRRGLLAARAPVKMRRWVFSTEANYATGEENSNRGRCRRDRLAARASAQACVPGCSNYIQGKCSQWTTCIPGSSPTVSMPSYGAIAYGRTSRAWGNSYHWGSRAKAGKSVALKNCEQHGNDCEVIVWFDRRCGAVVPGEGTAAYSDVGRSDRRPRHRGETMRGRRRQYLRGASLALFELTAVKFAASRRAPAARRSA